MQIYKSLEGTKNFIHVYLSIIFFFHYKICSCCWKVYEWKSGDLPNDSWSPPQTNTVGQGRTSAALYQRRQERCKLSVISFLVGQFNQCSFRTFLRYGLLGGEKKRWRRQGIRNIRNNCKILTNLYIFFLFICFYRKHLAFSPPVWKTNVRFTATTQKTCRTHTKWWPPYTCHRATSLKPWKLTKRCFFHIIIHSLHLTWWW